MHLLCLPRLLIFISHPYRGAMVYGNPDFRIRHPLWTNLGPNIFSLLTNWKPTARQPGSYRKISRIVCAADR